MLLSKKGIRLNNGGASSGGVIRFGLMNIKEFRASDLDVMQRLVGLKLKKFFKQLDFYIFVFGDETEYTLHTYCTFKVRPDNRILLTAADENYYPNCEPMPVKVYKKDPMHLKSLLKTNTEKLMQILGDSVIKSVKVTDTADIIIEFENGVVMEFFIDYTWQNSEYFRFFKLDDSDNPHYVVKFYDGFIMIKLGKID